MLGTASGEGQRQLQGQGEGNASWGRDTSWAAGLFGSVAQAGQIPEKKTKMAGGEGLWLGKEGWDSKWLYDSNGSDVNGFRVKFTAPGHLFCEYIDRCSYQQMYAGSLGPNCELRYRKGGAQDARW